MTINNYYVRIDPETGTKIGITKRRKNMETPQQKDMREWKENLIADDVPSEVL